MLYDVVFGSLATLLAALLTRWFKKRGFSKWLAPLPAVVVNALIVGALMTLVYLPGEVTYLAGSAYVGAGRRLHATASACRFFMCWNGTAGSSFEIEA